MASTDSLRRQLREKRRELSSDWRREQALQMRTRLETSELLRPGMRVAAYLPFDGEADPLPCLELASRLDCRSYLPIIVDQRLRFAPWSPGHPCGPNRFGIPEPEHAPDDLLDGERLDLVLVPLVAVDEHGNRIGMGAGFYDRSFAFLNVPERPENPLLVGVAHEFQRLDSIDPKHWDVPLDAVLTESALRRLHGHTGNQGTNP